MVEPHSAQKKVIDRRVALAREWDDLVGRARSLGPEFAGFLDPPRLSDLTPDAGMGTAVLINVTPERCDALLVSAGGVQPVPLRDLTLREAADRTTAHLARLARLEAAAAKLVHTAHWAGVRPAATNFAAHHRAKTELLRAQEDVDGHLSADLVWLWDAVTGPVLEQVCSDSGPGRSDTRVWWCPTGPLSFLPLHASGHHDGSGVSVLDRVTSSYTPTLRALALAAQPPRGERHQRMLAVIVEDLAGQPPLPQAEAELELLRELFPGDLLTVLDGRAATRAVVLDALPHHRWVHFSCHGRQNLSTPSRGGLLLADGPLTVTELGRGRFDGEFAFLSACMTATGGVHLSEEVVTLGAGLHYAGFRHVLATLWSIDADVAADLAHQIIRPLVTDGRLDPSDTAAVVNKAVRSLRAHFPTEPSRWAPIIHTGP
ncbi:CHAT domain-containing protein [Streptomyces sp. NPDC002265]|uniref:CHAT domain-containing protein n=1 Tax=Streptomyces sp. NPDC002265 TaxID=3154415 RepID=UPI0033219B24